MADDDNDNEEEEEEEEGDVLQIDTWAVAQCTAVFKAVSDWVRHWSRLVHGAAGPRRSGSGSDIMDAGGEGGGGASMGAMEEELHSKEDLMEADGQPGISGVGNVPKPIFACALEADVAYYAAELGITVGRIPRAQAVATMFTALQFG